MSTPVRILVVDDHTLFRRGLTALLGADARFCVVGEAGDGETAVALATEGKGSVGTTVAGNATAARVAGTSHQLA